MPTWIDYSYGGGRYGLQFYRSGPNGSHYYRCVFCKKSLDGTTKWTCLDELCRAQVILVDGMTYRESLR